MAAKHVVILGAGFAGLNAVRVLGREKNLRVTLVDKNNYHLFLPLLYQVASAGLEAPQIAMPIRAFLRRYPNANFVMGRADRVDTQAKVLIVDDQPIPYDYLIVGSGSRNFDFGIPGVAQYAIGLKSLDEALRVRDRALSAAEEAVRTSDPQRRKALLTFVIVGGGPTGVELAGALGELKKHVVARDYPELRGSELRIVLIEAGKHLLNAFSEGSSRYAENFLKSVGVEVLKETRVAQVTEAGVRLENGEFIPSFVVIWSAGVAGAALPGLPTVRGNRVATTPELFVPEAPEVYVAGDMNYLEVNGRPLPQVAPTAMQQGTWAARNILRSLRGQRQLPFRYKDKGNLAVLGRAKAVAELGRVRFKGFLAWVTWLAVHIYYLAGFRNRLLVLSNWAYSYLTYDYAVRVIHHRHPFPQGEELKKAPEPVPVETGVRKG
ncbi:MAG TPA: NAD(P)/FAD-dependent oxidoreductase [Meiothermus sp.]|nr:NAD(P)/FAD-dependent oxidoreductase [Meiothermus sp.]